MENKNVKRGFLLYFDSYPALMELEAEQRGLLLSALYVYADRVWREEGVTLEEILEQFPAMSGQARTACSFMGAAIQRDTRKWLSQREARSQRRKEQGRGRGTPPSLEQRLQREREDTQLSRRMMEQMREREQAAAQWRPLGETQEKDLTSSLLSGMMGR